MISTTSRVPFILVDSFSAPVTGVTPSMVKNTLAYVTKADGTTATIALTGANFIEVDSTNQPGIYQLVVPSTVLNVVGKISITLYPAIGSTFLAKVLLDEVGASISDIALIRKILTNNEVIDEGNALLRLFDDNGIDVIAEWYLQDSTTGKSILNVRRKIRKS